MSPYRATAPRIVAHLRSNVVGYLALFVALTGTASAAVIVSSNSDVGPNVIAGSKAKAGQTNNVIPGTIGTADLGSAVVTKVKLAPNAVDSSRITDGSV